MKNKFTIFIIIVIYMQIGLCESNKEYKLWKKAEILNQQKNKDEALKIYLELFENNQANYDYLKKINEILIEKQDYKLLIKCYDEYLENLLSINNKFEVEVKLLEIKIWDQDIEWINYLYILEKQYENDQNKKNKFEFISHQLFKNNKLEEGYNFILFLRNKYNIPSFYSRKLISIFKKNNKFKQSINESIIYLNHKSTNKLSSVTKNILIEQIFDLIQIIIDDAKLDKTYLPISSKQLSSNKFLNINKNYIYESNAIDYINKVYEKLIQSELKSELAQFKLAEIQYKVFSDLDSAYKIINNLGKKSTNNDLNIKILLLKSDILISKGYLDSALHLINSKHNSIEKYSKINNINDIRFKNIELLLYKGDYVNLNLEIDSLINDFELNNKNSNDLLELKMITLFFSENIEQFKKYSLIQHKLKMNKSFESILDLIDLINSDNVLISELAQFQYSLIEFQKGNIDNTQQIILNMNIQTIYYEIALIVNAEIEDYVNQNYKNAINLYEKIIEKYPDSIYKEEIIRRLNKLNEMIIKKIEL
jgi:hypothetical protein